jgi:hypothetical protein
MSEPFATGAVLGMMLARLESQREIIRLQAEVIRLQQRIESMTAAEPTNEEAWFHVATGKLPEAVLDGDDPGAIEGYIDYLHRFVNKHVAPYIHNKTKIALFAYLMRGIAAEQTRIQMRHKVGAVPPPPVLERLPARSGAKAQ